MPGPRPDPSMLNQSIVRGIEFLRLNQRDYGEFSTYLGSERELKKSPLTFDSSAFVTSLVVYCLSHVSHPAVDGMISKALDFLLTDDDGNPDPNYTLARIRNTVGLMMSFGRFQDQ